MGKKQKEGDKVIKLGSGGASGDGGRQGPGCKKGSGRQDRLTKVLRKGGDKRQQSRDNPHTFLSSIGWSRDICIYIYIWDGMGWDGMALKC